MTCEIPDAEIDEDSNSNHAFHLVILHHFLPFSQNGYSFPIFGMATVKLPDLPDEVIQSILSHVPSSTALSLGATSRRFLNITNEPLLWKLYCQADFKYWKASHRIKEKLQSNDFTEWKALYVARSVAPKSALRIVEGMIASQVGQIRSLENLNSLGYDVKDALLKIYRENTGFDHGGVADLKKASNPKHLSLRYWSHVALGSLHRELALHEWQQLKYNNTYGNNYERSVGAFDLFILNERGFGDLDDIHERLGEYVSQLRYDHPEIDDLSPRRKAVLVADYLLRKEWTGIMQGRSYHSLDHMFLGVALQSEERNSLPLISVLIYCYVVRKLGLRSSPCSYPWHVHAIVRPPAGLDLDGNTTTETIDPIYMDPFNTSDIIPRSMLETQLDFIAPHISAEQREMYLGEANAREITIRNARNILNSPDQDPDPPRFPIDETAAMYAAQWAAVILPSAPGQLRQNLAMLIREFLANYHYDIGMFEMHVLPLTMHFPDHSQYRDMCGSIRLNDTKAPERKLRSDAKNAEIRYKVGQTFQHRRHRYCGVVFGWDPKCEQPDHWIRQNRVDHLTQGRNQPFYNVLVDDGTKRYVAEENIDLEAGKFTWDIVEMYPIEIGKYFKRWDDEAKVFVSNVREEYPDD